MQAWSGTRARRRAPPLRRADSAARRSAARPTSTTWAQAWRLARSTPRTTTPGRTWWARAGRAPARAGHDLLVPLDGLGEADPEGRGGLGAEHLLSPLDVELPSRLPVGL